MHYSEMKVILLLGYGNVYCLKKGSLVVLSVPRPVSVSSASSLSPLLAVSGSNCGFLASPIFTPMSHRSYSVCVRWVS